MVSRQALYDGWTLRAATRSAGARGVAGAGRAGHSAGLRAHRPARRRPDRRPVPRRQRDAGWPGSGAPTGLPDHVRATGPATTSASTWSAPAWTRSPRSPSTASGRRAPRTCTAATASTSGRCCATGRQRPVVTFDSRRTRYAEAQQAAGSATGPTPTRSRTRSSARWPATSAGTGGRPWSPPASGGRSACTPGPTARLADRPPAGRPWTAATGGSTCTSRSSGPRERPADRPRRRRRRHAPRSTRPAGQRTAVADPHRAATPALWWPRGYGDQARYPTRGDAARAGRRHAGRLVAPDRLPLGPPGHHARRARHPVHAGRQRRAGVRPRRQLDPRRRVPHPDHPRPAGRAVRPGRRRQRQPAAGLGRRPCTSREDFYDLADELGLLVWQDFLFACAAYPEEEPFAAEVEAEAREQRGPARRRTRSLVLWTGNNENIWGYARLGLAGRRSPGAPGARGYYLDLLPRIVAELDPTRPYWPGSPVLGHAEAIHPNDPAHGTIAHLGRVEHRRLHRLPRRTRRGSSPSSASRRRRRTPRCAARCTDDPLAPDSPRHGRTTRRRPTATRKLPRGLGAHLPRAGDFDDWHYLTQLNQARAIAARRRALPLAPGRLHGHHRLAAQRLLAGHLLGRRRRRRAAQTRCGTRCAAPTPTGCSPSSRATAAWPWSLVNETGEPWPAPADGDPADASTGEPRAKTSSTVDVPAYPVGGAWRCRRTWRAPSDPARAAGRRGRRTASGRCGSSPRTGTWTSPPAACDATVEPVDGGHRVRVTARTLLRDLALFPDRLDPAATVDAALVTLLPGESATFTVHADRPAGPGGADRSAGAALRQRHRAEIGRYRHAVADG